MQEAVNLVRQMKPEKCRRMGLADSNDLKLPSGALLYVFATMDIMYPKL
jgi:hypothetical protein